MKEGKVFKRILAVALVVVMTITMVPFGVFAAESEVSCTHENARVASNKVGEVAAKCNEYGMKAYYLCPDCNQKIVYYSNVAKVETDESLRIDKIPHTEETISAVDATCTTTGLTEGKKCSVCGEILVAQTTVPATGHNYGTDGKCTNAGCTETCPHDGGKETITGTPATCTTPGVSEGEKCKVCGAVTTIQTIIPALNHPAEKVKTEAEVSASCETSGMSAGKYCEECETWIEGHEVINALGHTLSAKNVKKDDNQHAKKCTVCNEFDSTTLENHDWKLYEKTTEPTCTEKGAGIYRCTSCEAEKTDEIAAKEHTMTKTEAKAATCIAEGNIEYYTCSVCGKTFKDDKGVTLVTAAEIVVAKSEHVYTKYELSADATCAAHAKETAKCDICNEATHTRDIPATMVAHTYKNYVSDNNATCIEDGTMSATCEMCKTKKDTKTETGSKDRAEHTPDKDGVYCTLCGKELTCVHTYSTEKLITKVAKCEEDGQKAIVCSKCQAHKPGSEEVITKLGHKWDAGTESKPATCQEKGAMLHKCENAGCDKTKVEEIAIVDHDYKEEATQATCTEDGYSTFTCSMCGSHYVDNAVKAYGHMYETYFYDEGSATCYQDGTKTAECANGCGTKNTVADPGSKTDHEITDFAVIKEATCLEEGEEEAKCFYHDKCGYSEIVPTDALGHAVSADYTVDVAPTCTEAGKQSKHCARCDYKEGEAEVPALGHDYQLAPGTEATCLEGGYAKFTCTRCADSYEEANSPALGHDFVYVSDGNATCKEDGTESGKCSRCDAADSRTEVGSKLDHILGEPVVTPATTKADGLIVKTCTLCNEDIETEEIAKIESMKLRYETVAYDGKYKRPGLTITDANGVKLTKNEDYTLELPAKEDCIDVGTYTYTITFIGDYEGEETVSYKVIPGKTSKIVAKTTRQSYITLKWSAVKGADGYRVYVKNSKGKWSKLANVKGKNYYKVEDLKAGTEYTFAVKAFTKTDDGTVWATEFTQMSFTTLPGKTSKITYKSSKSAVKLTWKEVNGADGYRVYVYNTKTKKYNTVATVKGKTTYTVKDLKAGTNYKYAVKAYLKYDNATVWSNQYTTINTKTAK